MNTNIPIFIKWKLLRINLAAIACYHQVPYLDTVVVELINSKDVIHLHGVPLQWMDERINAAREDPINRSPSFWEWRD